MWNCDMSALFCRHEQAIWRGVLGTTYVIPITRTALDHGAGELEGSLPLAGPGLGKGDLLLVVVP